jgi:hypothetical protein
VRTLGRTTLGRPFIAVFLGDSATIADLPRHQACSAASPTRAASATRPPTRSRATGLVTVLVTSSIHSTEVGGFLTPLVLADRIARGEDDEARAIRRGALTILVPSLNPDGVDIVGDWYRRLARHARGRGAGRPGSTTTTRGTTTTATGTPSRRPRPAS